MIAIFAQRETCLTKTKIKKINKNPSDWKNMGCLHSSHPAGDQQMSAKPKEHKKAMKLLLLGTGVYTHTYIPYIHRNTTIWMNEQQNRFKR